MIASSNPVGGLDVCLLSLLCVVQVEASATSRSLKQEIPTEYVCVTECDQLQRQSSTSTAGR